MPKSYEFWLTYKDRNAVELFVSDGISDGRTWATYYRKPNGSLKRFLRSALPVRNYRHMAQDDLDAFAVAKKLRTIGEDDS